MKTIYLIKIEWHKENDKWVPGTDRLIFSEESKRDAWLADYRKEHPALGEKDYKTWSRELKDNEHFYRVYIAESSFVSDFNAILTPARDEIEARRIGNQYIRAWSITDQRIQRIERVV